MKKSLWVSATLLVIAGAAYGQQTGQYRGRTSQNFDIQFVVNTQGDQLCVDQVGFSVRLACPSGATTSWGAGFGGCNPIHEDGSFAVTLPPFDGAIATYVVPGQFTSDTTAEGGISFQASALRVMETGVDAQLCDSGDVTWTADHTSSPGEDFKFEGNEVLRFKDKATGNSITLYRLDSK